MTLQEIKNYIIARIYPNTAQEITGQALQDTLTTMAEQLTTREDFEAYKSEATEQIADRVTASEFETYQDNIAEALGGKQATLVSGENIKTISGKSLVGRGNVEITKEDVGLGNVDNTSDADKPISTAVATALLGKMPATPSGDPMHYAYEAVGAVYDESTGLWSYKAQYGGLTDLTTAELRKSFMASGSGAAYSEAMGAKFYTADIRTNILPFNTIPMNWGFVTVVCDRMFQSCATLEVCFLGTSNAAIFQPTRVRGIFSGCIALRRIVGVFSCSYITSTSEMFKNCTALEEVRIRDMKANISFADSPLSVESAIYALQNADSSVSFTITFRADRQAIFEANADFIAARDAKPNITIMYN